MWPDTAKMLKCTEEMGTSQQYSHSISHPTLHCTVLTVIRGFCHIFEVTSRKIQELACCSETNNTHHRIAKHWTVSERTLTALSNWHSVVSTATIKDNLLPAFGFNCITMPVKIRAKKTKTKPETNRKRNLSESTNKLICIAIPSISSRRVTFVSKDKQIHQFMSGFCVFCDQFFLFLIFYFQGIRSLNLLSVLHAWRLGH